MRIFISSGEPSGDLYGSLIAQELFKTDSAIEIYGMGGRKMAEAGVKLVREIDDLGIFGFYEGFINYFKVQKLIKELKNYLQEIKPHLFLPIGFPGVNLPLCKFIKSPFIKGGKGDYRTKVIYFAPPQIWAWGKFRYRLIKKYADNVICLFPFEAEFYKSLGINAVFLGNPLCDLLKSQSFNSYETFLKNYNIPSDSKIIAFMPGSRKEEVRRHLPLMVQIFQELKKEYPNIFGIILTNSALGHSSLIAVDGDSPLKYEIMSSSSLIILASGTASLEAALLGVPQIVLYRLSLPTYSLAKLLIQLKNFALPNILLNEKAVPELIQPRFKTLYPLVKELLRTDSLIRQKSQELQQRLLNLLGSEGSAKRIAREIIEPRALIITKESIH